MKSKQDIDKLDPTELEVGKGMLMDLVAEARKRGIKASFVLQPLSWVELYNIEKDKSLSFYLEEFIPARARLYFDKFPLFVEVHYIDEQLCSGVKTFDTISDPNCLSQIIDWFLKFSHSVQENGLGRRAEYYGL